LCPNRDEEEKGPCFCQAGHQGTGTYLVTTGSFLRTNEKK